MSNIKIRHKKIRGKKRILRNIDKWIAQNRNLDLVYLTQFGRDYVKFWVKPFCNLSLTNSIYPEPDGQLKQKLIDGLFEIYQHWQKQLDQLNKPYYLKIWLFEKHISRSQVVCAIDDNLSFYDDVFYWLDNTHDDGLPQLLTPNNLYPKLNWQYGIDALWVESDYLDNHQNSPHFAQEQAWFDDIKQRAFDTHHPTDTSTNAPFYYLVENDRVWVGGS